MIHNLPTWCSSIIKKKKSRQGTYFIFTSKTVLESSILMQLIESFMKKNRMILIVKLMRCIRTSATGYALALQIKLKKNGISTAHKIFFKQIQNFDDRYRLSLIIGSHICSINKMVFLALSIQMYWCRRLLPHVYMTFNIT